MWAGAGEDGAARRITLERVKARHTGVPHVIVSFEPAAHSPARARAADATETEFDLDKVSREQLGALEAELRSTRENLQAAIEQLEASNEELQASNEELLASNEELQSTNEELQSVNEELYTVNAEYQRKIAELVELTNDMNNLLQSTDVGTIFLDSDLRIRKFTPQIAQGFQLVAHDVGRPIETFAHSLRHPGLLEDLRQCLATGERVERKLDDVQGRAYFLRILPYRAKGTTRRGRADAHRRERDEGDRGRAVPRAVPARQPALQRAGRDLLQGRARPVHPREPRDGGPPRGRTIRARWWARARRRWSASTPRGRAPPPTNAWSRAARRSTTCSRTAPRPTGLPGGSWLRACRCTTAPGASSGSPASCGT